MPLQVMITDLRGQQMMAHFEEVPDACPICHRAVSPKFMSGLWLRERYKAQLIFQCVSHKCENAFIANYSGRNSTHGNWELQSTEPTRPLPVRIPEEVAKISPDFVKISNQVAAAEAGGLEQLVGIGLRKALEFLIKDFAISGNAEKAEEIKKEWLGNCIDLYIPDARVQSCAKRATWLGNDQAHYIKKWGGKDLDDLKTLVTLTVNWIHSHLATKLFIGDMPDGS